MATCAVNAQAVLEFTSSACKAVHSRSVSCNAAKGEHPVVSVSMLASSRSSSLFSGSSMLKSACTSVRSMSRSRQSRGFCVRAETQIQGEVLARGETEMKSLERKGIMQGGRWLSCTTRHIRIYVGYIDPENRKIDQSQSDTLSLMLDTDDEFLWTDETTQKVYDHFAELVDNYAEAPCTEYTLKLIGSDLEHLIRKMLLAGEIQYNLNCRVLNFSMGKPRYEGLDVEAEEAA
eukprot:jgi/Mesen1/7240/ME000373S06311